MQSYLDLLRHVITNGEGHEDRTGVGTVSVFGHQWKHNLQQGFPLLTTKRMSFRWVAEELRWFLSGSTDEHKLRDLGVDIWKEWATTEQCRRFGRREGDLGPVYGALWRQFPVGSFPGYDDPRSTVVTADSDGKPVHVAGTDQITLLINEIINNPNSRRLIVSGWHPFYQQRVALPPCHTLWQVKVHNQKELSLHLYARSIDSFLGLPFNIASYALLAHLLAFVCDLEPRDLVISFGDLHVYKNHLKQVEEQLSRVPHPLPTLRINERLRGQTFDGIFGWTCDDLLLLDYTYHPKISAPVAI